MPTPPVVIDDKLPHRIYSDPLAADITYVSVAPDASLIAVKDDPRPVAPHELADAKRQAEELARAVAEDGRTLKQAAADMGTTLSKIKARNPEVLRRVGQLIVDYSFGADERRKYVRAKAMEIAETAEAPRDQVAALKILATDPEVGLAGGGTNVTTNVTVGDSDLKRALTIDVDAD